MRSPCWATVAVDGEVVERAAVVIDPGHGGDERGGVGVGGLQEKEVNLLVALDVAERLEAAGVDVVLTRTVDQEMTIRSRAEVAVALDPVVFVSIHHNTKADGPLDRPGTTVYRQHHSEASGALGQAVYDEISERFASFELDWVGKERPPVRARTDDAGDDYYGVLRYAAPVPSVLVEAAFIDNPPEEELLASEEGRAAEAAAIADAIVAHLADPGPANTAPSPAAPGGPPPDADGCTDPELDG